MGDVRQILQGRSDALQEAADEHVAFADEVVADLAGVQTQLAQLSDWCSSTADILLDLAQELSKADGLAEIVPAVQQELLGESLDLTTHARPLIDACENLASAKKRAADAVLAAHRAAVQDHATELLGALAVEQALLQGENARLQGLKDSYAAHKDAFDSAAAILEDLRIRVQARNMDIVNLDFDIDRQREIHGGERQPIGS